MTSRHLIAVLVVVTFQTSVMADVFDRHTSYWLKQAAKESKPLNGISMEDAGKLKSLAANISSPCIVVKTNAGNWAKVLVGWGFLKGKEKPTAVLLIERFVTYRGERGDVTAAVGKDVMLFSGFSFNFDLGQVVPADQGSDVEFTDKGVLKAVGKAEIYAVNGSQLPEADKSQAYDPNDHDGVVARDFSGSWKVNTDGRWSGTWQLRVEENGIAQGRYTSEETKNAYDLHGKVTGVSHRIKLTIELDNAQQEIDAYLWTKDKSAMAGTATLAGRKFGFYAVREKEK